MLLKEAMAHILASTDTLHVRYDAVGLILCLAYIAWLFIQPHLAEYRLPKLLIVLEDEVRSARERSRQYTNDSSRVLNHGYRKYPDQPFGLNTTEGTNIVIPLYYLDILRGHNSLSFSAFLDENFAFKKYTKLGNLGEGQIAVLIRKINPSLALYTPAMQETIRKYWPLENYTDYTPVKLFPHVHMVASRISARMFQGSAAAGNEKWLHIASNYVTLAIHWTNLLRQWPSPLRPLVYRFLPGWKDLVDEWAEGRAIVSETLQRKKAQGNKPLDDPPSFLDVLTDPVACPGAIDDTETQVVIQMQLVVAAIQAISTTVMQALIDLATYNEILPELREEIRETMGKYGGEITKQGLSNMLKLDSFIKETQRLNSQDLTTFQRKATADLHLTNGMFIPKGATILLPSISVNTDESFFDDAKTFDALRFHRIRTSDEKSRNRHQFVSVGKKDLAWGYGKHACPGRFMADIAVKLVLIEFIMNYDIRNIDGFFGRPKNIEIEGLCLPDPECELMLRHSAGNWET